MRGVETRLRLSDGLGAVTCSERLESLLGLIDRSLRLGKRGGLRAIQYCLQTRLGYIDICRGLRAANHA